MILTMYDLSGIQSFIFSTNKLKEIIGGSILVSKALFENIPEIFGEAHDEWTKREFTFDSDKDDKKIVYIGGGNALIAYKNRCVEKECTRKLNERIFEQSGGALKLCSASIEADFSMSLKENQKFLMEELDRKKQVTQFPVTAGGFSINAHDNTTYEPVILFEDGYYAKSRYLKSKVSELKSYYFNKFTPKNVKYVNNFDEYHKDYEKNYLAVIHMDGNTMGIRIREFIQKQNSGLINGLEAMRQMSMKINDIYVDVLKETIEEIYGDSKDSKGVIPFRPIIADGDDITVICTADKSFRFVEKFIHKLAERELLGETGLTAGVGIAFVQRKFPFFTAYDIAEQCCKNAKFKTLEREYTSKSSIDFTVCYSNMSTDLKTYRKINYEQNESVELTKRPYIFEASAKEFDYNNFKEELEYFSDSGRIARSKLKGMRDAYKKGKLQAELYGDYIFAHSRSDKDYEAAQRLKEPYHDINIINDKKTYAKYFDVIDMMDITEQG